MMAGLRASGKSCVVMAGARWSSLDRIFIGRGFVAFARKKIGPE